MARPVHLRSDAVLKAFIATTLLLLAATGCGALNSNPSASATSAPPPPPRADEVSFELTSQQLTNQLNQQLAGRSLGQTPLGDATLKRIEAVVDNGQVLANGDAAIGSQTVPVTMAGRIEVQDGRPVVVVNDAKAAGVPLPQGASDAARGAIQRQVDQEVTRLQMQVRSVSLANGRLVLIGTRAR